MENPLIKSEATALVPRKGLPPWLVPGNPGQRGTLKPGSGRRPDWLIEHLEATLARPATLAAVETILANPNHPHFAKVFALALDRVYGRVEARKAEDDRPVLLVE